MQIQNIFKLDLVDVFALWVDAQILCTRLCANQIRAADVQYMYVFAEQVM